MVLCLDLQSLSPLSRIAYPQSRLATQSGGWQWINVTKSHDHRFAENGNDCHWPKDWFWWVCLSKPRQSPTGLLSRQPTFRSPARPAQPAAFCSLHLQCAPSKNFLIIPCIISYHHPSTFCWSLPTSRIYLSSSRVPYRQHLIFYHSFNPHSHLLSV